MKFQTILSGVSALGVLALVIAIGITTGYLIERGNPVTKYYSYYGSITARAEFTYPERIHSFTFGTAPKPLDLTFVNDLWCTPINSFQAPDLIVSRSGTVTDFEFRNALPEPMVGSAIEEGQSFARIGLYQQQLIRKADREQQYQTWTMGNNHPHETSRCFIDTTVTGYSTVFKIPKTINYSSGQFVYIVPQGVYDESGNLIESVYNLSVD